MLETFVERESILYLLRSIYQGIIQIHILYL